MKKQFFITFLLTMLMSMVSVKAYAYDIAVENADGVTIYYSINSGSELTVVSWGQSCYSGNVVIPEDVTAINQNYKVTEIGDYAFYNCGDLTSVTIPNSVISIGNNAFKNCQNLISVTTGNSLTSIGKYAFEDCCSLFSINIPNIVTTIDEWAFSGCRSLTSITIPNSVTDIKRCSFNGCSSLTDITIPNSVTTIGNSAFGGCNGLKSVTIPSSVTSIGDYAFNRCTSLASVTIPSSVTSIGSDCFQNCSSLNAVYISDLEAWCKIKFGQGSNPLINAPHLYLNYNEIKDLVIPNSVASIGDYAFQGCTHLTSVTIHKNVTSIGYYCFQGCSGLASMVVEKGNLIYDSRDNCNAIVETSSDALIFGCKNTIIPNSVTSIGVGAFFGCTHLTSLIIPNSVKVINQYAFIECSEMKSIELSNSITAINKETFYGCTSLTSISIPDGVKSIAKGAFQECKALASVAIPNSVTSIGASAFSGCSSLTSITIPNSITSLDNFTFHNCGSLTSITIPNSIKSFGRSVFNGAGLITIVSQIENPFEIYGKLSFDTTFSEDTYLNATLYVPMGTKDKYKTTYGWKDFSHIVTIGSTPDDNGTCGEKVNYTYNNSTHTLTISGSGSMAKYNQYQDKAPWFSYADEIQNIIIESGITYIGDFAFYKCNGITDMTLPATVTFIGSSAFEDCTSLTSLTLNEGLETINGSAFEGCTALKTLTIPSTISSVLINAFKNCKGLTEVYSLAENVPGTADEAFDGTPMELITLFVPANAVDAYKATSPWKNFKNIIAIGSTPEDNPIINGFCGGNVNYSYNKENHTLTISGSGDMTDYYYAENDAPWSSYASEIQNVEIESGVTSIGSFAFYKCSGITSLTIPSSVKSIGSSAFEDCTSLSSLTLNEGLETIGGSAFESCAALNTLTIPSTVSSILINAFKNCKGLTDVYFLAERVPGTSDEAFNETPTESITLHVPATAIDAYKATSPWSGFKSIVAIGSSGVEGISAKSIGGAIMQTNDLINYGSQLNWSFTNNSNANVTLLSMQLIDGVTKAEGNVMSVNQVVESGSTVSYTTTIGLLGIHVPVTCRFRYDYNGEEYSVDAVYTGYSGPDNPIDDFKLTIETTGNGIVTYNGTSIRDSNESFNIQYFGDVTISFTPDDGYRIKYVKINNTDYTSKLSNNECTIRQIMEDITVEVAFEAIPNEVDIDGVNYQLDFQSMTAAVISGDYSGEIVIPSQINYNGTVYSVTKIDHFAFYKCSGIISLTIPSSVKSIGSSAFEDCTGLESLTLNEGLEIIGGSAFESCTGLKTLTIPSTVKSILLNAIKNCTNLTDVYCLAESVPDTDDNAFHGTPTEKSTLHVPSIAIDAYKSTWPWSDFKEIVALDADGISKVIYGEGAYTDSDARIYDLQGNRQTNLRKGVNIIRLSDGKTKKVVVK